MFHQNWIINEDLKKIERRHKKPWFYQKVEIIFENQRLWDLFESIWTWVKKLKIIEKWEPYLLHFVCISNCLSFDTLLSKICWEMSEKMEFHWLSRKKKKSNNISDYLGAPSALLKTCKLVDGIQWFGRHEHLFWDLDYMLRLFLLYYSWHVIHENQNIFSR